MDLFEYFALHQPCQERHHVSILVFLEAVVELEVKDWRKITSGFFDLFKVRIKHSTVKLGLPMTRACLGCDVHITLASMYETDHEVGFYTFGR